jgi:RNA polymerase I-specific transcription-initiation factor
VLVFSRAVDLVLAFRLGLIHRNRGHPVSLADPLPIFLSQPPNQYVSRSPPSSSVFRAIECRREAEGADGSEKPSLFKLFSLYDDFSIVEHLFSSTEPGFGLIAGAALSSVLQLPYGTTQPDSGPKRPDRATPGSFVVPDDVVEWTACLTEKQYDGYSRNLKSTPRSRAPLNLDWQDVYNHVIKKDNSSTLVARINMTALISRLSDHLNQARTPELALLSELMSLRLHVGDIDDDSDKFEHFTSSTNSQQDRVKVLEQVRCESSLPSGLSSAYDAIVAIHLTPLSPQIPDRVRVNKERLARTVSADLLLASTAICPRFSIPTDFSAGDTLSKRATSQPTLDAPVTAESAPRPASDPSTITKTPTIATAEEDPLLTRLRDYTTISPTSSSTFSNPTLASILRHFPTSPYTDPKTYNYRVTERTLAAEHEEEIAIAAGLADPRARRRAEKARLRREEAKRRATEEAVSRKRAPPRLLSSQAQVGDSGHGEREVQSSQVRGTIWDGDPGPSQGQESRQGQGQGQGQRQGQGQGQGQGYGSRQDMQMQMPMTQPERGAFGTRLGVGTGQRKDKGKKRAAGF